MDKIFVVEGFDDNDKSEVVLHGDFRNSCNRLAESGAVIDAENKTIEVWSTYYEYPAGQENTMCAMVMIPFIEVVDLGILDQGEYNVTLKGSPEIQETLTIAKRKTESPDDYLYAPVTNGWVETSENGRQAVVVQGTFPLWFMGCQIMTDVQVQTQNEAIVVQPITEIVDDERCDDENYKHEFNVKKGISAPLKTEGLLHIRTLNSHAINRFVPAPVM